MVEDLDLFLVLTRLTHAVRALVDYPFAASSDIVTGGAGSDAFAELCLAGDEAEAVVSRFLAQEREKASAVCGAYKGEKYREWIGADCETGCVLPEGHPGPHRGASWIAQHGTWGS